MCPECGSKIEKLARGKRCHYCSTQLHKIGRRYIRLEDKKVPSTLLVSFEETVSKYRNVNFFFSRGKEANVQLVFAADFFIKCCDFLSSQTQKVTVEREEFAKEVLAEVLTPDKVANHISFTSLNRFISNGCAIVYAKYLRQKKSKELFDSLASSVVYTESVILM